MPDNRDMADSRRKPRQGVFQFRLRTVLAVVTLFCITAGWFGMKLREARRQHVVVDELAKHRFPYWYDYQTDENGQTNYNAPPRGAEWLRSLLGFDFFNHVTEIRINGEDARTLDDGTFRAVLDLPDLQTLDIDETAVTQDRLSLLHDRRTLSWLSVEGPQVTDRGLREICSCSGLKALSISGRTKITPTGLMQIARLKNLERLWLSNQPVTDEVLRSIRGESNLRELAIDGTSVTDAGMAVVGRFTRLTFLGLSGTAVTDRGLSHLEGLTDLTILWLDSTHVTDRGLASLANMQKLELVGLNSDSGVTDAGLTHLEVLPAIHTIELNGTRITAAGYKRLTTALPQTSICVEASKGGPPLLPPGASIF